MQSVEPCLSTTKAKPTTTPQALSIERKNERRRALGAPPRALALICTRVCFFFLFRALLFRFPMTRSRILLSFAPLRARWPKRGAGSRGAHENECFFFASLSSHRSFVDVGKRKKKTRSAFPPKKKKSTDRALLRPGVWPRRGPLRRQGGPGGQHLGPGPAPVPRVRQVCPRHQGRLGFGPQRLFARCRCRRCCRGEEALYQGEKCFYPVLISISRVTIGCF